MTTKNEQLLNEIADFLVVYMKSGKLNVNSFVKDPHLNIRNIEDLLKVHFLLKKDVVEFVSRLPVRIRKFKTSTTVQSRVASGQVKGQMNWPRTFKERLSTGNQDTSLYAYHERSRSYQMKENLVLKEMLSILYRILFHDIRSERFANYGWFQTWKDLKPVLKNIYEKNIYLNRIQSADTAVTGRMIQDTLKHRNPLYRDAAKILLTYRKVMDFEVDQREVMELLKETFIEPEKEEVLFELYWVIQFIKQGSRQARLHLIDGKNNLVAQWEDQHFRYDLYHDSTGSNELIFEVPLAEVKESSHPYLVRKVRSFEAAETFSSIIDPHRKKDSSLWRGRPDILLEVRDKESNKLVKVVIGEVKHTPNKNYAIQGLRELVDYLYFVKDQKGNYIFENDLGEEVEIMGALFLDEIEVQEGKDDGAVQIVSMRSDNKGEKLFEWIQKKKF